MIGVSVSQPLLLLPRFAEEETTTPLRWVTAEEGQGDFVRLGFIPPFASQIRHDAALLGKSKVVILPTLPSPSRRAVRLP